MNPLPEKTSSLDAQTAVASVTTRARLVPWAFQIIQLAALCAAIVLLFQLVAVCTELTSAVRDLRAEVARTAQTRAMPSPSSATADINVTKSYADALLSVTGTLQKVTDFALAQQRDAAGVPNPVEHFASRDKTVKAESAPRRAEPLP